MLTLNLVGVRYNICKDRIGFLFGYLKNDDAFSERKLKVQAILKSLMMTLFLKHYLLMISVGLSKEMKSKQTYVSQILKR